MEETSDPTFSPSVSSKRLAGVPSLTLLLPEVLTDNDGV